MEILLILIALIEIFASVFGYISISLFWMSLLKIMLYIFFT